MELELNELAKQVYETAKSKGWYDNGGPSPLERHMLIVSEIAEATEEVRNKKPSFYLMHHNIDAAEDTDVIQVNCDDVSKLDISIAQAKLPKGKPEGEAVELADALIRIADIFGSRGCVFP